MALEPRNRIVFIEDLEGTIEYLEEGMDARGNIAPPCRFDLYKRQQGFYGTREFTIPWLTDNTTGRLIITQTGTIPKEMVFGDLSRMHYKAGSLGEDIHKEVGINGLSGMDIARIQGETNRIHPSGYFIRGKMVFYSAQKGTYVELELRDESEYLLKVYTKRDLFFGSSKRKGRILVTYIDGTEIAQTPYGLVMGLFRDFVPNKTQLSFEHHGDKRDLGELDIDPLELQFYLSYWDDVRTIEKVQEMITGAGKNDLIGFELQELAELEEEVEDGVQELVEQKENEEDEEGGTGIFALCLDGRLVINTLSTGYKWVSSEKGDRVIEFWKEFRQIAQKYDTMKDELDRRIIGSFQQ